MFYFLMGPFGAVVKVISNEPVAEGYLMTNMVFWLGSSVSIAFVVNDWDKKPEKQRIMHVLMFGMVFTILATIAHIL